MCSCCLIPFLVESLLPPSCIGNGEEAQWQNHYNWALFCFLFVLREVEKHPTTKRQAQQSKPACYTNKEQVAAARCSQALHGDVCNSHTRDAALYSSIAVWDRHKHKVQGSLHLLMVIQPLHKPNSFRSFLFFIFLLFLFFLLLHLSEAATAET